MFQSAIFSIGLALMAQASSAPAETGATPAAAPPPAAAPAETTPLPPSKTADPKVLANQRKLKCEKIVKLGSRMPVRVCRTQEQIDESEREGRDLTNRLQKYNPEQYN